MKVNCIINPIAGDGKACRAWFRLLAPLSAHFPALEYDFTKHKGHATQLAKEAVAKQADLVIAFGGDGTFHEIVNGLAYSKTALAIVPTGSGNDFARSLKLPATLTSLADVIIAGNHQTIDLGIVNGRYFLNMAGIGFDAEVAQRVHQRSLTGTAAYVSSIIETIFKYKPLEVEIDIDGTLTREKITMVAVGNGRYVGGGVFMLPKADITDGLLDVCLISETTKGDMIKTLPATYFGKHLDHPKCRYLKLKEITIRPVDSEHPAYAQLDGEGYNEFPLRFKIAPQALKLVVPGNPAVRHQEHAENNETASNY